MAFDLDQELRTAIAKAEVLYGVRESSFQLLPVGYHDLPYAQTLVSPKNRTISVKIAQPEQFPDPDSEARYELWHEAVHCLCPVMRMDTLWFEEGIALQLGLKQTPIDRAYLKRCRDATRNPWKRVLSTFNKLSPSDGQIRATRERAQGKLFDNINKDLIIQECGAKKKLAEELCQRLDRDTR